MKKYYVQQDWNYTQKDEWEGKEVLVVNTEDIVEEVLLDDTIRILKEDYNKDPFNLENYEFTGSESYSYMKKTDAENYYIVDVCSHSCIHTFFNTVCGYDYESLENAVSEYNEYNHNEVTVEEVEEFIKNIPSNDCKDLLVDEEVYYVWDGNNHRRLVLYTSTDYNLPWIDYTEEYAGFEEIDRKDHGTGGHVLKQRGNEKILVNYSRYQTAITDTYYHIDGSIETVEDAINSAIDSIRNYCDNY